MRPEGNRPPPTKHPNSEGKHPVTDTAAPTVRVRAFHNIDAGFLAYKPSDRVTLVFAAAEPAAAPEAICEALFELLNIGDDPALGTPDPRAVAYRERGNRSLSVGDVVAVDKRPDGPADFYAVASTGFTSIAEPRIVATAYIGTTPLS